MCALAPRAAPQAFSAPMAAWSRAACLVIVAGAVGCSDEVLVNLPPEPAPLSRDQGLPPPVVEEEEPSSQPPPDAECTSDDDCPVGEECETGTCVGVGTLQITLTFDMDTDLDLHVLTPSGAEIYYGLRLADGGELDVDQCVTTCGAGVHVENVFFLGEAPTGPYQAWAINFDGRASGNFTLDVSGATTGTLSGALPAEFGTASERLSFFVP